MSVIRCRSCLFILAAFMW